MKPTISLPKLGEAAARYATQGWHVLPLHHPVAGGCSCGMPACDNVGKHPRIARGFHEATTNTEQVRAWWEHWPDANIGIAPGPSGLVVIDVDEPDGEAAAESLGLFSEPTWAVTTGRVEGGRHLYFRHPGNGAVIGNRSLAPHVDVRADGGYVVAPPSVHASGKRYRWEPRFTDAPLPLPPSVVETLRASAPKNGGAPATSIPDKIREGERNNKLASFAGTLRRRGFSEAAMLAQLRTMNDTQCDPPLEDDEVERIAASIGGYPTGDANPRTSTDEWPDPVPFDAFAPPPFPVDVLPDWLATFVRCEAEFTQTPVILGAQLALTVVAAAVARKIEIEIAPGRREPLNIFTCTAANPGERKSAVLEALTRPLVSFEMDGQERQREDVEQAASRRRILEKQRTTAENRAGTAKTAKDREAAHTEAAVLTRELAATPVPVLPRLVTSNVSPEKLEQLLAEHRGRMAVLTAEADVFEIMAGLYTRGTPNFTVFLKGHAGDLLATDRMSRSAHVRRPALTLGVTMQPGAVHELHEQKLMLSRGLLARFLWAVPDSRVGTRRIDAAPVPPHVAEAYGKTVGQLLQLEYPLEHTEATPVAHTLVLTPDAKAELKRFEQWIEPQLAEGGELEGLLFWASKLGGTVARLAGLLHVATHVTTPWDKPVSLDTMRDAVRLGRCYIPHAEAAFGLMHMDTVTAGARRVLRWLNTFGGDAFTVREAHIACRRSTILNTADDVRAALTILTDRHYVRLLDATEPGKRGRPTARYAVNPRVRDSDGYLADERAGMQDPTA